MTSNDVVWLTVPEVGQRLGLSPGQVHRLVEEHSLLGKKIDGIFRIPESFLGEDEPVKDVRGTIIVLLDGGFPPDRALEWILDHHDELGTSPIDAIRQGRKTEVRRVAQVLAL